MAELDLIDRAVIAAPAQSVWQALHAEFLGARAWWVPWNTFEPGVVPPEVVGGETRVTVHSKGVGRGGPQFNFTARTRAVEPDRRWAMDYVDGVFRGSCEFLLAPVDGGRATELTMAFRAQPRDLASILSRVVDFGHEHSKGIQGAMINLDRHLGGPAQAGVESSVIGTGGGWAIRTRQLVATDDGAELAVTVDTPGQPLTDHDRLAVVLVHGWGASAQVWRECAMALLAAGRQVISYDQRGHGRSSTGREAISVHRLGQDLGQVLEQLKVTDAVVVAHSGGAFATLALAAEDPQLFGKHVQSLVLAGTAARDRGSSNAEVAMMGNPLFAAALRRPALGRRLLGQMVGAGATAEAREANRRLFAETDRTVRAATFRASQKLDLSAAARRLDLPTVVLTGTADQIVEPAGGEDLAELLPLGRFRAVVGAGHMLPLEAPEAVVGAVQDLVDAAV